MVRTLFLCAVFAGICPAAPVPKDFIKPVPKLDGKWKVTSYETNGRESKVATVLNQTWTIEGENLSITRTTTPKGAGTTITTKAKLKTDAKKSPMELDYTLASGTTRLGVFAVDGDTLTICLAIGTPSEARPDNLDGGQKIAKYVFKRVEK